jgi:chromosome partitioning protein
MPGQRKAKGIVVAQEKGGVGKTTTALTLGDGLSRMGYNTLVVDFDPQGHVAFFLNQQYDSNEQGLLAWFINRKPWDTCVLKPRPDNDKFWILPIDRTSVSYIVMQLASARAITMMERDTPIRLPTSERLEQELRAECQRYDVVIFDTNPALDYLPVIALQIANLAIIPTLEKFADASQVDQTIHSALRANPGIVYRILPTKHDRRTREGQTTLEELQAKYQGLVLDPIPEDVLVSEAPRVGQTILEYAPSSNATMGYIDEHGDRVGGYNRLVHRVGNYLEGMHL